MAERADHHLLSSIKLLLFQENGSSDEKIYQLIKAVLKHFPPTKYRASMLGDIVVAPTGRALAKALPMSMSEYTYLQEEDGIGPIHPSVKIIKRLYEEEEAFLTLPTQLCLIFMHEARGIRVVDVIYLSQCRIMYRYFPSLLKSYRSLIGSKCPFVERSFAVSDF